jgi:hypothetical protein
MEVVASGVAIGFRVTDSIRVGTLLRFERVSLRMQESFSQYLSGQDNATTSNVLSGATQVSAVYSGEANRLVTLVGAQFEVSKGFVIGIVSQLPSQPAGGVGSIRIDRSDQLLVTQNGATLHQATGSVHIASDSADFQLQTPGSLRMGIGLLFDTLVMEFNLDQRQALAPYNAFPALESGPPSTIAVRQNALVTKSNAVTRYGFSAAIALGTQASWFLGLSNDPAPVPSNDSIFRKVDALHVTTGYYTTRGAFAGSIRAIYTMADAPAVRFPHLSDDSSVTKPVRISTWVVGLSGSYVY